jgi:hypothetical protein
MLSRKTVVEGEESTAASTATQIEEEVQRVLTPQQQLADLESAAIERGISQEELGAFRDIGECEAQTQTRIKLLNEWLANHV